LLQINLPDAEAAALLENCSSSHPMLCFSLYFPSLLTPKAHPPLVDTVTCKPFTVH